MVIDAATMKKSKTKKNSKEETVDYGAELIDALNQITKEKGIDKELIFEAIETSLISACKKNFGGSQNVKVAMDRETGSVDVFALKTVVENISDPNTEMTLDQARGINASYELGDVVEISVKPRNFGRISAQTAKQVVVQKFREAEREILYSEYITKEREVITGIVQRSEKKNIIVALGKIDASLPPAEQIPGERYEFMDRLKVYVSEVKQTPKGPIVNVSRTHPELVKRLFEQESPEVHEGLVVIKSIAREAGSRTKMAVFSNNPDVDPIGACIGHNGYRVNVIVAELNGEKIDLIPWSDDPEAYIEAALSPSRVTGVLADENEHNAIAVVPDNQLSLAIGKEGQNVRLAAKLTGWKIDIKSETQARAANITVYKKFFAKTDRSESYIKQANYEVEYDADYDDDYVDNSDE